MEYHCASWPCLYAYPQKNFDHQLGAIGDVIRTTPLLRKIRKNIVMQSNMALPLLQIFYRHPRLKRFSHLS